MEDPLLPQEPEEAEEEAQQQQQREEDRSEEFLSGMSNPSNSSSASSIPSRQALLLKFIFGLLGIGILIPWNAFISAKPYFQSRFCKHDGDDVNPNLESNFALCYNLAAISWLGALLMRQSSNAHTNTNSHSNHHHGLFLVVIPLSLYVAVFVAQSIAVNITTQLSPRAFQALTLAGMALCGMCGATATAGILATAGLFQSNISTAPFLAGQSVGGVAVSLANFFASAWEDPHDYWQTVCQSNTTTNNAVNNNYNTTTQTDTCTPYEHFDAAVFGYFVAGSIVLMASLAGYIYIEHYQHTRHRNEYETVDEAHHTQNNANHRGSVTAHWTRTHSRIKHKCAPPTDGTATEGTLRHYATGIQLQHKPRQHGGIRRIRFTAGGSIPR